MTNVPYPALTRRGSSLPIETTQCNIASRKDSRNAKHCACYTSLRSCASAPYTGECSASCSWLSAQLRLRRGARSLWGREAAGGDDPDRGRLPEDPRSDGRTSSNLAVSRSLIRRPSRLSAAPCRVPRAVVRTRRLLHCAMAWSTSISATVPAPDSG
jgi:hypothetical protein